MAASDQEESYLTVAEVAATLKLNQQTVRNWIDQGSLPALRVGRRVRIKRSDFERILDESYSGSGPASADAGPSADDFWSGELVGLAEPGRATAGEAAARATTGEAAARIAAGEVAARATPAETAGRPSAGEPPTREQR